MRQVRATRKGYDGKEIREEGDVFPFAGKLGSWMEEVDSDDDKSKRGPGRPKATSNASSLNEKPLHKDAKPESGKHDS
jgi:hypothetical protein